LLGQLLDQAILQRPEHPLRATPSLGRIGWNVLDSQAIERAEASPPLESETRREPPGD